jgi:hypothetical protein
MKLFRKYATTFPCFYCGVDSEELKIFLFVVIGGLVIASTLVGIGVWIKGGFANTEKVKEQIFEFEKRD